MRRSSEDTKAAILTAARKRFADDGYERATIRAVASDAGIDPSMVMRYFGNKQGLFASAVEFDLRLPDLRDTPRDELGRALAAHLVDRWSETDILRVLLRSAVTNPDAAERMRTIFADQLGTLVARLDTDPAEAAQRAGLLATQALGFELCRHILELPPVVDLTREEAIDWLAPTMQHYLTGPRT
ncbi:TetR family transcriptional regulator [Spirillospora sp. CA-294931]|uniref:TetR/AcrR family transcriptional regulator n=1 Tax=Spirillospora sp. CA-294931 TaxID=3240042 RepID=UPI003D8DE465